MNQPIKQYCKSELTPGQIHFVLRLEHVTRLSHVLALYAEAKRDFPSITPDTVQPVCYGSDILSVRFGIEFTLCDAPPKGYQEIDAQEFAR